VLLRLGTSDVILTDEQAVEGLVFGPTYT
jgi:hypothetical protein